MKCETAQQVFSDYVEETIEEPLAVTFERHLEQCEECRRSFGDFRSTWRVLETFPVVGPPPDFRESLLAKVKAQQEATQQRRSSWGFNWGDVLGARVPTRAFAWTMIVLIFAVLLIKVSSPVFQSSLASIGGVPTPPTGPGLDMKVRVADAEKDADVYQIALSAAPNAGQLNVRICRLDTGEQLRKILSGGGKWVKTIKVQQPQGVTEPPGLEVRWSSGGSRHARVIYLPISRVAVEVPDAQARNGKIHDVLRRIASEYGVVVCADVGVRGSVTLSGKYEGAQVALNQVARQADLEVRREGSVFSLEPR